MTYEQHKDLKPEDFKRLCGVHKGTFSRMVSVLQAQVEQKKKKPGKPSKLSVEDQVSNELGEKSASTERTSTLVSLGVCMKQQSVELSERWKLL